MVDRFGSSYNISELVIWSAEEYTTMQFSDRFRHGLPVLCRVSEGYSGRDDTAHTVGKDEMFWIFEIYSQPRMTFIDDLSRQISIPLDYRHRFQIVGDTDRASSCSEPPRRMIELAPLLEPGYTQLMIESNKRVSFGLGADRKELGSLGLIRFKERRDVDFLIGYPLIEEFLHPVPILLPTYVPAEVRVALGFQYGTSAEFSKFTAEMKKAVSRFAKLPAEMCNDMIIFSDDSNSDTDSLYIYPGNDNDDSIACLDNNRGPSRQQQQQQQQETPCSPTEPPPQRPTAAKPVPMRRPPQGGGGKDKPFPLPPMPRPLPQIEAVPDKEVVITYFRHFDTGKPCSPSSTSASTAGKTGGGPTPAPPIPPRRPDTGSESPFNQRRRIKDIVIAEDPEEDEDYLDARELMTVAACSPPPPPPPPLTWTAADYDDPIPGGGTRVSPRDTSNERRRRRYWQVVADIPLFVSTFTIDEVCYCLEALNMGRHAESFVANHVDGELLVSLNENVLQTTFEFTEFDAIKLMKFAKDGWRPRLSKNQQ